jgi:hypothetical protein
MRKFIEEQTTQAMVRTFLQLIYISLILTFGEGMPTLCLGA